MTYFQEVGKILNFRNIKLKYASKTRWHLGGKCTNNTVYYLVQGISTFCAVELCSGKVISEFNKETSSSISISESFLISKNRGE